MPLTNLGAMGRKGTAHQGGMVLATRRLLNLPNWITMGRLAAVPILLVLLLFIDDASDRQLNRTLSFIAAGVFTAAMCSDVIDGYLARKYCLISTFGTFVDPLADKLLFLVTMVMLIPLGRIPAWLAVLFLVREMAVTTLREVAVGEGIVISASHWGKYKSAFVSSATVGLLLHYPFFGINWRLVGWVILIPGLFFSIYSGLHYAVAFVRKISRCGQSA